MPQRQGENYNISVTKGEGFVLRSLNLCLIRIESQPVLKSKIDNMEEQAYPLVAIAGGKGDIKHNSGMKKRG